MNRKEKIKSWKEKILKDDISISLEKKISNIPVNGDITKIMRKRLGFPTRLGELLDVKDLVDVILDILGESDAPIRIDILKNKILDRNIEVNLNILEELLYKMASSNLIIVKQGYISLKKFSDTGIAIKILNKIKAEKNISLDELLKILPDEKLLNIILDDLSEMGLITYDKENRFVFLIS